MQLVITFKDQVLTTSLLVADKFGKRHDDVLRTIRSLECTDDFRARNFTGSSYKSLQNKDLPLYIITKDGFTMLMMSFTGSAAAKFREDFINEFNRMEQIIRQGKTPVLLPTYQKRMLSEPTKNLPDGYWSIFDESHSVMLFVETNIGSVNEYDLVDGSIGKRWCVYREDKTWAAEVKTCVHDFGDNRQARICKCYQDSELPFFRKWLRTEYKIKHLPNYLIDKFTRDKNLVLRDKVHEVLPKLLRP